jgi:hypothetical protein
LLNVNELGQIVNGATPALSLKLGANKGVWGEPGKFYDVHSLRFFCQNIWEILTRCLRRVKIENIDTIGHR